MNKLLYILSLLLLSTEFAYSDQLSYYNFNEAFGLEKLAVFDMKEGTDEMIWFGTDEGLYVFNGINLNCYRNSNYEQAYYNLKFDSLGRVWCSNFSGQLFYLQNDSLHLAYNGEHAGDFIRDYSIWNLPLVTISFAQRLELAKLDMQGGKHHNLATYTAQKILSFTNTEEEYHFALRATSENPYAIQLKTTKKEIIELPQTVFPMQYRGGKTGLLKRNGFFYFYEYSKEGTLIQFSANSFDTIYTDANTDRYDLNKIQLIENNLWVLARDGVKVIDLKSTQIIKNGLPKINASCVIVDGRGNTWLGTLSQGIFIVPNKKTSYAEVGNSPIAYHTIDNKQNLYLLLNSGELFKSNPPYTEFIKLPYANIPISPLFFDSLTNKLFFGSHQHYLDLSNNKLVYQKSTESELLFKESISLSKGYYISTSYSMAYSYADTTPQHTLTFTKEKKALTPLRLYRSDNIGIARDKKTVYINYVDGLVGLTSTNYSQPITLNNNRIRSTELVTDNEQDDVVWCTTTNAWLLALKNSLVADSVKLPEPVYFISFYKNMLVLATKDKTYIYNKSTRNIRALSTNFHAQLEKITGLYSDSTNCYFISMNKVISIPFNELLQPPDLPSFKITNVYVDGVSMPIQQPFEIHGLKQVIQINFLGMQIATKNDFYYQYRLNNQAWIKTNGSSSSLSFSNLSQGDYSITIQACVNANVCTNPQVIHFKVVPPFYRTLSFYLLLAVFVALLAITVLVVIQKKQKENTLRKIKFEELQKEMYQAKIASLRSQMNPHFVFNSLNTIQEFIMSNKKNVASEYLADFADLIRIYLSQSQEQYTTLATEIKTLCYYLRLEKMRLSEELNFNIEVDASLNTEKIKVPLMLIQPYVENAVKHGLMPKKGKKNLSISFKKDSTNILLCSIQDNGIGRAASTEINKRKRFKSPSFSTQANKQRIELINSFYDVRIDIKIIDLYELHQSTGTLIEIRFPFLR